MNPIATINLFRRYPHWAAKRCIFVHVPRVAGTSINFALYGRTLGHYRANEIRRIFPGLYRRCFVFAFVRNPWDRILSAYRFARKERTALMGISNPALYRIPEFDSFERFLMEWLPKRDIFSSDFVFQPQHTFVLDSNGEQMVDFLGRFETLSDDISHVEGQLGHVLDVNHTNQSGKDMTYRDAYTNQLMIDVVRDVYERDIQQFGYVF